MRRKENPALAARFSGFFWGFHLFWLIHPVDACILSLMVLLFLGAVVLHQI